MVLILRDQEDAQLLIHLFYSNLSLQRMWEFTVKDVYTIKLFKQKLEVKARVAINIVTRMEQYDGLRAS